MEKVCVLTQHSTVSCSHHKTPPAAVILCKTNARHFIAVFNSVFYSETFTTRTFPSVFSG